MNLQDLTEDERVALVALVVLLIDADNARSSAEMQEFSEIAAEMGRAAFEAALGEVTRRGLDRDGVLDLARGVTRRDAQEIAHTILVDMAATDFVSDDERELIHEVAAIWGIQTRV